MGERRAGRWQKGKRPEEASPPPILVAHLPQQFRSDLGAIWERFRSDLGAT